MTKLDDGLAVRIPADVVRALGIKEGDTIDFLERESGHLTLVTQEQRRAAALARIRELARPLPANYKFDREEANAR
ncbi:AbrB/MazE/SpoVT family DNA-binding domain-containing protein [Sphingomonas floccifaciens]|uniref:AbrB/MazE/SpoVT family DNA-binding domain-containing protein n=1 Tax=Sphingomonas floccifaciens TaxID=1844115 RepID=UPI0036D247F8